MLPGPGVRGEHDGVVSSALADPPRLDGAGSPPLSVARLLAHGAAVGVWVCVATFGVVAAPVLIAWLGAGADEPLRGALSVAAAGWLVGNGATLMTPDASVDLTPLGLTVVALMLAYRGGLWAGESGHPLTGTRIGVLLGSTAATSAAIGGVVAAAIAADSLGVDPGDAAVQVGLVAVTGAAVGVVHSDAAWRRDLMGRVPTWVVAAGRPVMAALALLLAASAALTTVAIAASFSTVTETLAQLDPGAAGLFALLVLCLAYLPTLLVWVLAVAVGATVSVGTAVSVGAAGVGEGALPGFPLLAVVPDTVPLGVPAFGGAAMLTAGVVAGLVAYRSVPRDADSTRWHPIASATLSGLATGLVLAVATWAASGSMGPGDLAVAGAEPARVGGVVAVVVALAAAGTAAAATWRASRQRPILDDSDSFSSS